ncbi:MAG: hypothetical protein V3V08_09310 [Nannocystaceae bacterium]
MTAAYRRWIAAALGLLTVAALAWGHRNVGYVRDEGIYFEASRHYGTWAAMLVREPTRALSSKTRDRYLRINREHPPLMKFLAGVSARLLAESPDMPTTSRIRRTDVAQGGLLPVMPEGAAMRLPAQFIAGLGVAMLYSIAAASGGICAGLLAAGWFILLPRVAFHAGLHSFDVPSAVTIFAVVMLYRRTIIRPKWSWLIGPLYGIALVVKHNAIFVAPLLVTHYYACMSLSRLPVRLSPHRVPRTRHLASALFHWAGHPLVALCLVAPIVAFCMWPWLWSAPVERLVEYLAFHRDHAYYNMEFLGHNYNRPPLPVLYPFVMTFATAPLSLILVAIAGLVLHLRRDASESRSTPPAPPTTPSGTPSPSDGSDSRSSSERSEHGTSDGSHRTLHGERRPFASQRRPLDGILLLTFALFPLLLIAWPTIPIFGGTKHWITAYPFLALAAAEGWRWLWAHPCVTLQRAAPLALCWVLLPGAWGIWHGHPNNLSQYAPLVGGARGAAELGLNRGFWGHAALGLIRPLDATTGRPPQPQKLYLHDLHDLARKQYRRERRWPAHLRPAKLPRSDAALLFYEQHMRSDELEIWRHLHRRPSKLIQLDDVPLAALYEPAPR